MSEHAPAQRHAVNPAQTAAKEAFLSKGHEREVAEPSFLQTRQPHQIFGDYAESRIGFDFSGVPAFAGLASRNRPVLRTQPMVQRFAKNEALNLSSCPTCSELEPDQTLETHAPSNESIDHTPEATTTSLTSEPLEVTSTPGETALPGLIVEDSAIELASDQMKRSEFLTQLKSEVCRSVEAALAGTGRTTDDCPYLNYWFDFYSRKDSMHIERAIRRYAPETSNSTTASGYISAIAQRAGQAAETWVRTGEISGVPEGVATTVPGETPVESGEGAAAATGPVMLKSRSSGLRTVDDPHAVQAELGEGLPLSGCTRSRMEPAFGMDFSHVRTHTDTTAARLSNRLNARAFTVGDHVAFGANEYKPGTLVGDALIAHELAHVVQQGSSNGFLATMQSDSNASSNALEHDADQSSLSAVFSIWCKAKGVFHDIKHNVMPSLRSGLQLQRCDNGSGSSATTSTTVPSIASWSARTRDGDSTSSDNCCSQCRGVTLGVDCDSPNFKNGIELKAVIAGHLSGYSYDIKRTKEGKYWRRNGATATWSEITAYAKPAGSLDDSHDSDECLTPIASGANHHIYSIDRPGLPSSWGRGSYTEKVQKMNFIEFVRITKPDGTTVDDSNTQDWHTIMWISKSGTAWSVNRTQSEISTGHLSSFSP